MLSGGPCPLLQRRGVFFHFVQRWLAPRALAACTVHQAVQQENFHGEISGTNFIRRNRHSAPARCALRLVQTASRLQ